MQRTQPVSAALAALAAHTVLAIGLVCASVNTRARADAQPAVATKPAEPASAPAVRDERVVAGSVQAFYDQTRDVSAGFHQTYVHKFYQRTDRSRGRVVFKKPGKMRWDYAEPNGKVIVTDGGKLLVYEPGDEGEQGQVIEQAVSSAQLPAAMAFLVGTGRLEQDFNFRLLDSTREGFTGGDVLELRPKAPSPHYDRILFYVDNRPELRGLVRRLLIIDAEGNRNRFDFTEMKFNSSVPDAAFQWKPPAGTRRVEM